MVSPSVRRMAARRLQQDHGYSLRRACGLVATPRSGMYYRPRRNGDEDALRAAIRFLARRYPRYGCPRIHACLDREGWKVNPKRLHRIWRDEGLSLQRKRPRRRRWAQIMSGAMTSWRIELIAVAGCVACRFWTNIRVNAWLSRLNPPSAHSG